MPDIEELLAPISEESPAGRSIEYDVIYDEIEEERRADDPREPRDPERDGPRKEADYGAVERMARKVLTSESKDLQVAAWLTEAWTHRNGLVGLRSGIDLARELLVRFWDEVHPGVDDGELDLEFRAVPLHWLGGVDMWRALDSVPVTPAGHTLLQYRESREVPSKEEAGQDQAKRTLRDDRIEQGFLTPEEFEAGVEDRKADKDWYRALVKDLEAVDGALAQLLEVSEEKFEGLDPQDRPDYRTLRKGVDSLERGAAPLGGLENALRFARKVFAEKLKDDPDPVEVEPAPAADDGALGGTEAGSGSGGSASSGGGGLTPEPNSASSGGGGLTPEPTSKDDAGQRIAVAARYLREADPLDPGPYLMIRGFRWGELRRGGSDIDPRLLAAPPTRIRTHLKGLLLDGRWEALLEAAEDVMATAFGRGWLDLQRYVFTALGSLGSEYAPVEQSIRSALRALLLDLPDLPDLTLMDDTPTANRETRAWLQEEGLLGPLTDEERARMESDAGPVRSGGRDVTAMARERARAGQPQRGIELLMRAADDQGSVRGRALHRAEAAAIMVEHGLAPVALPILRDIERLIGEHGLEGWEEPSTVARPLALLVKAIDETGDVQGDRDQLYLEVCRIDPMQAMMFNQDDEDPAGAEMDDDGVPEN
jgi:type VI secretion system protein ImpA